MEDIEMMKNFENDSADEEISDEDDQDDFWTFNKCNNLFLVVFYQVK